MGKIGGSSWLTAVKKAFRSPSKENEKRSSRRREEYEQEEEEKKKRAKRRWIFRKPSNHETVIQHCEARNITASTANAIATTSAVTMVTSTPVSETADAEKRRALAVAMATTAAAEAAVATAQAAVEIIRLTRPSIFVREQYAAIVIQTAFRGYLARRALRALKGLVKLQALVRGQNVRNRAKMTLQCMQAMIRVQTRVRDQRKRLSYEGSIDSIFSNPSNLWESHLAERKSISRNGSNVTDEYWDDHPRTAEEFQAMLGQNKEAASKREKALAYAFSHQMWRTGREPLASDEDREENPRWLDRWTTKQWESRGRSSFDQRADAIKTVEIDTSRPYSYSAPNFRKSQYHQHKHSSNFAASPRHRAHRNLSINSPITPSPINVKPLQVHSASPRCQREERSYPTSQTPNLGSSTYFHGMDGNGAAGDAAMPNYMAATASAKARVRSQSAPRQRPSTPEREKPGSARKRLSFPVPEPCSGVGLAGGTFDHNLISPRIHGGHLEIEQRSNMSSCCTDSFGDEIPPPSTSELRRWLR